MQSDYVMLLHFIVEAAFNYICFGGIEKYSTKSVNSREYVNYGQTCWNRCNNVLNYILIGTLCIWIKPNNW